MNSSEFHAVGLHRDTRWYVVANRAEAKLFKDDPLEGFVTVEVLSNPDGALHDRDLDSDRPGRLSSSAGGGSIRHGLSSGSHRQDNGVRLFAKKITTALEKFRNDGQMKDLVVAAEPHFLGILKESFAKPLENLIKHEIHRDFSQGSPFKIQKQILHAILKKKPPPELFLRRKVS